MLSTQENQAWSIKQVISVDVGYQGPEGESLARSSETFLDLASPITLLNTVVDPADETVQINLDRIIQQLNEGQHPSLWLQYQIVCIPPAIAQLPYNKLIFNYINSNGNYTTPQRLRLHLTAPRLFSSDKDCENWMQQIRKEIGIYLPLRPAYITPGPLRYKYPGGVELDLYNCDASLLSCLNASLESASCPANVIALINQHAKKDSLQELAFIEKLSTVTEENHQSFKDLLTEAYSLTERTEHYLLPTSIKLLIGETMSSHT